ncbi:MAG: hypothetical protein QOG23_4400 [Blastocatellia bacterium]|nr:hypothetical protein [Blastocatellia bacterium]
MLTGFNTDVEYEGVVYHVQTEDKGLQTPFILSLVYTGGAILASKRSPYDDLIAGGFDEDVLAKRLSRQHKLICAAIHAGRIEDLKRLGERDAAEKIVRRQEAAAAKQTEASAETEMISPATEPQIETAASGPDHFAITGPDEAEERLRVILLDEVELSGGNSVTLRVLVSRAAPIRRQPARKARVVVKVLGSTFRPTSTMATTSSQGIATIPILLPLFETGRAAVLIQAHIDGETAELRRVILPAKSS